MAGQSEIVGVQYLRGLAAVAVVICHAALLLPGPYLGTPSLGGVIESGRIGADLFFLISGFIITIVSLRGPELTPAIGVRAFFTRRAARILPLLWVAVLTYAAVRWAAHARGGTIDYIRAALLLPWGAVRPWTIWTLRQELVFYVVFALAMLGPRAGRWLLVLWAIGALVIGSSGFVMPLHTINQFIFIVGNGAAFEFLAGMGMGWWWLRRDTRPVIRLAIEPLLLLALAFAIPLGLTAMGDIAFGIHLPPLVTAILCLPVLWLGVHADCPAGPAQRFGTLLGDASYSIYLFHPHLLFALMGLLKVAGVAVPGALLIAIGTVVAVAGGVTIHRLVEVPLIAAARRLSGDGRGPPDAASPATDSH